MWNVFDSSFIIVFLAYMVLRFRGLLYDNGTLLNNFTRTRSLKFLCSGVVWVRLRHFGLWRMHLISTTCLFRRFK